MKPLCLHMQAFGPYPASQTLNFHELGGQSLFLIHGPTGAGKTTILDAICYALYGSTSANDREGKQMRSDLADPALATEITFDFALGDEQFRISRRPEQHRPKRRGGGYTLDPAQATLWKRTGCDDGDEGTVLESQASRVTDHITQLLGFNADQFRQVVLLPQGKFRELLLAPSKDREAILASLFQTQLYEAIAMRLKERARLLEGELKEQRNHRQFLFNQAGVDSREALVHRLDELTITREELAAHIIELRQGDAVALAALSAGRQAQQMLHERDEASAAMSILTAHEAEITLQRQRLHRARCAAPLAPTEEMLRRRITEAERARRQVQDDEASLAHAQQRVHRAQEALAQEEARAPERNALQQALLRLQDLRAKVGALADARMQLAQADAALREERGRYAVAQHDLLALDAAVREREARRLLLQQQAATVEAARLTLQESRRVLELRERYEAAGKELLAAREFHAQRTEATQCAEVIYRQARAELERLQHAWESGQAAILARTLQPETPCPVCGSTHHPSPALAQDDLPTEAMVKQAQERAAQCEQARDEARAAEQQHLPHLVACDANVNELAVILGEGRTQDIAVLRDAVATAQQALDAATAATEQLSALAGEIANLQQRGEAAQVSLASAEQAVQAAVSRQANAAAIVAEREEGIPEALRDIQALEQEIAATQVRRNAVLEIWEQAQAESQRARDAVTSWEARLQADLATATAADDHVAVQEREFSASLVSAGFSSREDFAAAHAEVPLIAELETAVAQFDRTLEAARDRAHRAAQAAAGIATPDLGLLEQQAQAAAQALETGLRQEESLRQTLAHMTDWLRQLDALAGAMAERDERYMRLGRLAEVANGKNPLGITFQRFVLAALLDDVLLIASKRLHLMSKGRYTLQRVGTRTDGRRSSGLDLEVADTYTGVARPVATLSGGESFLASLALALGLADVVQQYAGGIRLDTIFIDEGFGSLDPEALDLALRTLIDLQSGGRLVGIISHVPELRERIDVRLEVTAGISGSTARFVTA